MYKRQAIRRIDQEFERGLDTIAREQFQKIQVQLFKDNPNYTRSIPGVLEYYERMFACIKEEKREIVPESIIERVKLYISINMQQELSREEVSAYVGLHPDYLNRLFKKETGVSLKEYIADEKVHMAVSYTHLDVYKRQTWYCKIIEGLSLLLNNRICLVVFHHFSIDTI